jgi:hypothetical protein
LLAACGLRPQRTTSTNRLAKSNTQNRTCRNPAPSVTWTLHKAEKWSTVMLARTSGTVTNSLLWNVRGAMGRSPRLYVSLRVPLYRVLRVT